MSELQPFDPARLPKSWEKLLDMTDLWLLSFLSFDCRSVDIAKALCLSQPAITLRVNKIYGATGIKVLSKRMLKDDSFGRKHVSEQGLPFCIHARSVLEKLIGREISRSEVLKAEPKMLYLNSTNNSEAGFLPKGV